MAKKRGHGEGSIYKRKDGMWTAALMIQGKRLIKYSRSRGEAQEWIQELQNQIRNGLTFNAAQLTVNNYLQEWLDTYQESIRPKTFKQYKQITEQYLMPGIGNLKLRDLRPDHIQALYTVLLKEGKSQRTVLLIHAVLHRALNQALKWSLLGRNPAHSVNRPKYRKGEMHTLNENQVKVLLKFSKSTKLETLLWMAVTTGLREGEILGLKWSDLDWVTRTISVQRQLQRLKNQGLVFSTPKSEAGERPVMLSVATIRMLRGHHVVQFYEKLFARDRWQENDLIFPSSYGSPMDPRNLYKNFKNLLNRAKLPDIRFHDLRHTAATLMLQNGIHPKVVQERLGHKDVTLTLNTYSHVLPDIQEEAAQKLDRLLAHSDANIKSESQEFERDIEHISPKLLYD